MKVRHYIGERVQVPPGNLYTKHITMAKNGVIPINRFKVNKVYTPNYIGTWPIDVARTIAMYLRRNGIRIRIRGRGKRTPKRRHGIFGDYYYAGHGDLLLKDAERGALYLI